MLENLTELVQFDNFCDIVVFSFQQIKNFEESEEKLSKAMIGYTKVAFQTKAEYVLVVFVENSLSEHVSRIDFDIMSLPFRCKPSQKLAIVISFSLFDSSFCLISCHLVSGIDNNCVRKDQINYIHNQAFGKTKKLLKDFDAKLLFGNLNFRINYNSFQVLSYLENSNYEELLKAEQLTQNLKNGYLLGYKESFITFPPNFPYIPKTNDYDVLNKRNPS